LSGMRKRYDGSFKARVALEAIRGDRTVAEIATACGVHLIPILKPENSPALSARNLNEAKLGATRVNEPVGIRLWTYYAIKTPANHSLAQESRVNFCPGTSVGSGRRMLLTERPES